MIGAVVGILPDGDDVKGAAIGGGIGLGVVLGLAFSGAEIRSWFKSDEDLVGDRNQDLVDSLKAVYRSVDGAPLIHAAGHEHSLQVMRGDAYGVEHLLVSGSAAKSTPVDEGHSDFAGDSVFAIREKGYMRLDFSEAGVRLTVVYFGRDGRAKALAWCRWLRGGTGRDACSG